MVGGGGAGTGSKGLRGDGPNGVRRGVMECSGLERQAN